jgi:hypothetical protein
MFDTWILFGDPSLRVVGVAGPGFTISAGQDAIDLCAPDEASIDLEITQLLGFEDPVTLSASGNPAGTTVVFADNPIIPPATTQMTVIADGSAPPGVYEIEVTGTAGEMTRSTFIELGISTDLPAQVTLASPPDGATEVSRKPTLMWNDAAQALSYHVQVDEDAGFSSPLYDQWVDGTEFAIVVNLESLTTYYWRVEASNGCGLGTMSDTFDFTTLEQPDYFTEEFIADNDLSNYTVEIAPDGSGDYYAICGYEASELPTDPVGGTTLPLSDDDYETVIPSQDVSFYGIAYDRFYVGSNGYITFDTGDTDYSESLADHFDQIRISGLFDDLNPSAGGTVSWKELGDRVAITWDGVPEYYDDGSNTFQIELFFDGMIRMTWLGIGADDGIAGLSEGEGVPPEFGEIETDLSSSPECGAECVADINGDDAVNVMDLLLVLDAWGMHVGPEDMNGDGVVNVLDLLLLLDNWGPCP